MKIFPLGGAYTQPRRHLGFWDPLISQEVIETKLTACIRSLYLYAGT